MADKTFHVEIVTPERQAFSGEASLVTLPGVVAPFQVLFNHAAILTQLEIGDIRIVGADGRERHFATSGGFAEVSHNRMSVIADTVEDAHDINVHRAEEAKLRAADNLQKVRLKEGHIDSIRAEAALARAKNRLRVAVRQ